MFPFSSETIQSLNYEVMSQPVFTECGYVSHGADTLDKMLRTHPRMEWLIGETDGINKTQAHVNKQVCEKWQIVRSAMKEKGTKIEKIETILVRPFLSEEMIKKGKSQDKGSITQGRWKEHPRQKKQYVQRLCSRKVYPAHVCCSIHFQ